MADELMLAFGVLACLQAKHFIADYLLQPRWVIRAKGHFDQPGGYCHAGVHALGSVPALVLAGLGLPLVAAFMAAEFAVHFLIDHAKARHGMKSCKGPDTAAFWAMHGFDQFLHHMTYLAMTAAALWLAAGSVIG
ncbi:MAG: DUF3307 domain-containing protein [Nitratireductor sp.]